MDSNLIINMYVKQYKIIYLYLVKCGCSPQDAEDIVHESFVKAIQYIETLDTKYLSSWLFRVAVNNYKNRLVRNKIISINSVYEEKFIDKLADNELVEDVLINKEYGERVKSTLDKLNEQYKMMIILKYDMELSYREISLMLGIKEDKVKTYLYRSRNKFKEVWREENE